MLVQNNNSSCVLESDEIFYWKQKELGKFQPDEWVVIRNGGVLIKTDDEKKALEIVEKQDGMCLVYQVNHENDAVDIHSVECEFVKDIHLECHKDSYFSIVIR